MRRSRHGHPRPAARDARDVDFLVPADQLEAGKRAAQVLGYTSEAGPLVMRKDVVEIHLLSKPDPETGDLLSLDLLLETPALEAAWSGRERVEWEHGSVPVVTRAGLAAMKRLRGSGQDQDDIRLLEGDDDA